MSSRRLALACAFLLATAATPSAQSTQDQMLVSPACLQSHSQKVTVLHVGDAASYASGHIPGAVLIETASLLTDRDGVPNEMPPTADLEQLFRKAGVNTRERIVVYGNDLFPPVRAWLTLDYLGQGKRASLLDGGLRRWIAEGHPTSQDVVVPRAGTFKARPSPAVLTPLVTLRGLVKIREQIGPNLVLIDTRSLAEFAGETAGAGVLSAGHIPGAVSIPADANLDANGLMKRPADLRLLYQQAGVTRGSANIVYCRTGMQASLAYFVLRYLGYEASLYDGSFTEWSNAGEPIST